MKKSKFILLALSMLVWSGTATADLFGGGKWCEIPYEGSVMRFNTDKVIMVLERAKDGFAAIVFEGVDELFKTKIQYRELVERCFK